MAAQGEHVPGSAETSAVTAVDDATMRDIVDKLSLLHYETEFCQLVKPPFALLTYTYFSSPSTLDNANMQFYYFTSLCTWLMGMCGHRTEMPGQFDDPNVSATNLLAALRSIGVPVTGIAPNRVKQGSGEAVLAVLSALVEHTLSQRRVALAPIDYSHVAKYDDTAADADTDEEDDGGGATLDIEDRAVIDSDDDDDGNGDGGMYVGATAFDRDVATDADVRHDADEDAVDAVHGLTAHGERSSATVVAAALPRMAATSSVRAEDWQLEVERVAPLLQVRASDDDSWRVRVEHAAVLKQAVETMYPSIRTALTRMGDDLDKSREHIQKREQTLAQQFSEQVEQYRVKLRELSSSREAAAVANASVQQLTMELNHIGEQLEHVKRDTEEHEAKISDTTPLMQVKAAVVKVQSEIRQMSLRIGVLQHSVLMYVMKQTKAKREQPMTSGGSLLDDNGSYEIYYD